MSAEGDQQCGANAAIMLEELREIVRGWHEGGIESRAALEKMADCLGIVEDTPAVMKDPPFAPRAGSTSATSFASSSIAAHGCCLRRPPSLSC